jgi:hypothetical protein
MFVSASPCGAIVHFEHGGFTMLSSFSKQVLRKPAGLKEMSRSAIIAAAMTIAALSSAAEAATLTFRATLSGANETPPVASPGTGTAEIVYDEVAKTLAFNVAFSGLVADTTVVHVHCCTATPGVGTAGAATTTPTLVGFPVGVRAGTFNGVLDLTLASSFGAAFLSANGGSISAAAASLLTGMQEGTSYFNIHSEKFVAGEISGFIDLVKGPDNGGGGGGGATDVPIPAALPLLASALGFLGWRSRRRKS